MVKRSKPLWSTLATMLLIAGAALFLFQHDKARAAGPGESQAEDVTGLHDLQGEAFVRALNERAKASTGDSKLVANAILGNYIETRRISSNWSGLYWGFAWVSAALSALAGVLLKLESLKNESVKRDVAALFSVAAAIFITVSTGGDFQRKWQANRIASAEIEHLGYDFLASAASDPKSYYLRLGEILLHRQQSIVGQTERKKPGATGGDGAASGKN